MIKTTSRVTLPFKTVTYAYLSMLCLISGCGKNDVPKASKADDSATSNTTLPVTIQENTNKTATTEIALKKPDPPIQTFALNDLLSQIPTEFKPTKGEGWDKFTLPKVKLWVSNNLYGKTCTIITVANYCNVQQSDDPKPGMWQVMLQFGHIYSNYGGMRNRILMPDFPLRFTCNVAEARRWDAAPIPMTVKITGIITGINFENNALPNSPNYVIGYDTTIQLDNPTVDLVQDDSAIANYLFEADIRSSGVWEASGIVTIRHLESKNNYHLIFLKAWRDINDNEPYGYVPELSLFPLEKMDKRIVIGVTKIVAPDGFHTDSSFRMRCSDPPTASEIVEIKEKGGWPKDPK